MGKVEKVVVLSVLFLIASILVISITVEDPLDTSRVVQAGGGRTPAEAGGSPALAQGGAPRAEPGLLSAQVTPPGPAQGSDAGGQAGPGQAGAGGAPAGGAIPGTPEPAAGPAIPPGSALRTSAGLEPSALDDLMIYTWREGDSWRLIAHTYYGDWQRNDSLKMANEGRIPSPGDRVFVPVYLGPTAVAAEADPAASPAASRAPASARPAAAAAGRVHVVKAGESLWKIAKLELGDGNRWKEIAKANEKVLKGNPDAVKVGMELRIP